MKNRCPNSKFVKRVYLEGYRFVYDGYSTYRSCAVANLVKEEGSIVWGALYEINETYLKKLDRHEGYPSSYDRKILRVKDDSGKQYDSWVYLREPREKGEPSESYRSIIIKGAKDCGLPEDYIKKFVAQEE